jgi:hypothetical protein
MGPTFENGRSDHAANPARTEAANTREAVFVCWQWCLPESVGGEACACKNSREGGFHTSVALASTVLLGYPSTKTARCGHLRARVLKALSLLRFFVAKDQEMTCCHAQWLIVIKRKSDSRRPLTLKAATRHRPRPLTPEPSNPALTPTTNPELRPRPLQNPECQRTPLLGFNLPAQRRILRPPVSQGCAWLVPRAQPRTRHAWQA